MLLNNFTFEKFVFKKKFFVVRAWVDHILAPPGI